MGLFEFLDSLIGTAADNVRAGQEMGMNNLKHLTDKQLLDVCKKTPSASMKGMGEYKAYLDEARRRKLIK